MKQIFTLFALGLFAHASAQVNEPFDTYTSITQLEAKCWSFIGTDLTTATGGISGSRSLRVIPTTSNNATTGKANFGQILTPNTTFFAGATVSFTIRMESELSTQGQRTVTLGLADASGAIQDISGASVSFTQADGITTKPLTYTFTSLPSGSQRIALTISGKTDGKAWLLVDDFILQNATYTPGGCQANSPLPVKLMSFAGSVVNRKAELRWSVAENETGDRFVMERSTDGKSFTDAATVFTSGKTGSESYTFTEAADLVGNTYYKLRIVNKDGSISYSRTVFLKNVESVTGGSAITLLQNPMQSQLAFSYQAPQAGLATVNLYNMVGIQLMSFNTYLQPGVNTVFQSLKSNVVAGTYILEILHNGERRTTKPTRN